MDDDRLTAAIRAGHQAEAHLADPVVTEAFRQLEGDYINQWAGTDPDERHARERIWTAVHVLADVRAKLSKMITDGRIARGDLERLQTKG